MSDELKPVKCGCGGEAWTDYIIGEPSEGVGWFVCCKNCEIQLPPEYPTEAEAVTAWNKAMSGVVVAKNATTERTAKVIEHDASITDDRGYKYLRSEYLCENCKKKVIGGDEYCSHCGCRLDWNGDIPMEYFESGGR